MEAIGLFISMTIAAGKVTLFALIVFALMVLLGVPPFGAFCLAVVAALILLWWDDRRRKRNS